jgi:hypothetical protein
MSFKTRVLETLRSVFVAHPSTKIPHAMLNASDTEYRKTSPGFVDLSTAMHTLSVACCAVAWYDLFPQMLCFTFFCSSQPDASIPNHTVPETAISYYKRKRHQLSFAAQPDLQR